MNTTVYAAMLLAFLNASDGKPMQKDFTEISRGSQGSLRVLVQEEGNLPNLPNQKPNFRTGLRGDFKDGKTVWLSTGARRDVAVGVGYQREF